RIEICWHGLPARPMSRRPSIRHCSSGCGSSTCRGVASMARSPAELLKPGCPLTLASVVDGAQGLIVCDLARAVAARVNAPVTSLLMVCRDGPRMTTLSRALAFFAPDIDVLEFPAWDCLPYDRVSPHAGIIAQRMTALS